MSAGTPCSCLFSLPLSISPNGWKKKFDTHMTHSHSTTTTNHRPHLNAIYLESLDVVTPHIPHTWSAVRRDDGCSKRLGRIGVATHYSDIAYISANNMQSWCVFFSPTGSSLTQFWITITRLAALKFVTWFSRPATLNKDGFGLDSSETRLNARHIYMLGASYVS